MNEAAKFAEHAANQNDRYLFLLTLCAFAAAAAWGFKWLIARTSDLEKQRNEEHREHTSVLAGLVRETNEGRTKCAENLAVVGKLVENIDARQEQRQNEHTVFFNRVINRLEHLEDHQERRPRNGAPP